MRFRPTTVATIACAVLALSGLVLAPSASAADRLHRLTVTFPHTMVRGQAAAVRVLERPIRQHRLLKVWFRPASGGAWRLAAKARETKHGKAGLRFSLPSTGGYTVRLAMSRYREMGKRTVKLRQVYAGVKVVPSAVPLVMAHRGGGAEAPENTMAAFSHAVAVGAPVLETDVHRTSDGVLVLLHDDTLRRTTNVEQVAPALADRKIWTLTAQDVAGVQVDVGPGAPQPVPQFSDLLALLQQNPGTRLLAEAKDPGSQPNLYSDMLAAMNAAGLDTSRSGRAAIESFDRDGLQAFAAQHPGVNVSPIMQQAINPQYYTWAGSITLESPYATAAQIARLHAAGLPVNVWTLDSASALASFADAGADAVITDIPTTALSLYH